MFRKISFFVLSPYLLSIFIRSVIIFVILCIIIPKFSGRLQSWHTRIEIFILIMILIETLISRIKITAPKLFTPSVVKESNSSSSEDALDNILSSISQRLKRKNCIFFLRTPATSLEHILKKLNYSACDILHGKENGIEIFDNLYELIVCFKLENFKQLNINPVSSGFIIRLLKLLAKNKCNNINLLVSINDLIQGEDTQEELYRAWYLGIQSLNKNLNTEFNLNLIIDDIAQIEGFYTFFENHRNLQEDVLGVSFFVNSSDTEIIINKFSAKFRVLLYHLESIIIHSTYSSSADYQLGYMFIQQLTALEIPISKLLECIKTSKKGVLLGKKNERLITVSFTNSANKDFRILPLMPRWLKPNVTEVKVKNG